MIIFYDTKLKLTFYAIIFFMLPNGLKKLNPVQWPKRELIAKSISFWNHKDNSSLIDTFKVIFNLN